MATARPLVDYPPEYFELFLRACHERVVVQRKDTADAKRFRGRLYAFREALYCEMEKAPKCALVAPMLRFRLKGDALIVEPLMI